MTLGKSLLVALVVCAISILSATIGMAIGGRGNLALSAFVMAAVCLLTASFLLAGRWKFSPVDLLTGYVMAILVACLVIGYISGSWLLNSVNMDWLLAVALGTGIPWLMGCIAGFIFSSKRKLS